MSKFLKLLKKKLTLHDDESAGVRLGTKSEAEHQRQVQLQQAMKQIELQRQMTASSASQAHQTATEASQRAAQAAVERIQKRSRSGGSQRADSTQSGEKTPRWEEEQQRRQLDEALQLAARFKPAQVVDVNSAGCARLLFQCPEIFGDQMPALPREDLRQQLVQYCQSTLGRRGRAEDKNEEEEEEGEEDRNLYPITALFLLHTANKPSSVRGCCDLLKTVLANVRDHPLEAKYRRLRLENIKLKEAVFSLLGGLEFLQAIGFEKTEVPLESNPGTVDQVLVLPQSVPIDSISDAIDLIDVIEPVPFRLFRDTIAFKISDKCGSLEKVDLPAEWHRYTEEDLRKEHARQQQVVEESGMLMTRAMRERLEQRELKRYLYCLVRIRFPDNTVLQGTFESGETVLDLMEWVSKHIRSPHIPFQLNAYTCKRIHEFTKETLAELKLTPMSVIFFAQNDPDSAKCSESPFLEESLLSNLIGL